MSSGACAIGWTRRRAASAEPGYIAWLMAHNPRRTEAWTRRDLDGVTMAPTRGRSTGAAATLAATSAPERGDPGLSPTSNSPARRSLSVLPTVSSTADGALTLLHEPRERYRKVGVLGEGGMGVVERAEDVDIGRSIAIKRLLPEIASDPQGVARFVGEVQIVGGIEHPNVVPIHDVGVDDEGRYFFVMKYVEGETLAEVIDALAAGDAAAHGRWTFERRAEVMIAVLRALEYAHARGIVHRDVKPENVMIGRFGEVWLLDWGIAARTSALAASGGAGGLIGTPAYMSPEQASAAVIDGRSDLYAAAVMFHELLGLRHYLSHKSENVVDLLTAIAEEPAPTISGWRHESRFQPLPPRELRGVCVRAMAKDPAARTATAGAMIAEIQAYLDGRNNVQCVYSFTKRSLRESGRLVDRYPKAAVALFFAVLGFALIGAAALVVVAALALVSA